MIKHIVCFKLKEGTDVKETANVLRSMEGKVPTALKIEVGEDFLHSDRSYDIILQVTLKDRASLEEYQNDEYMHLTSEAYADILENLRLRAKELGY